MYRLSDLQFNRSQELAAFRDNRLNSAEQKEPRRGRILDADGKIIAEDQPTQDLWIFPASKQRIDRRLRIVSNFPPLTVEQMVALSQSQGESRRFERNLAVASLAEGNALVAELASRLKMTKEEVAEKIVSGILSNRPRSPENLIQRCLAISDIDFSLALELRASQANPFDNDIWSPTKVFTGGKRVYPFGALLGHLTGTVGKLTAEEYVELRGRWDEDQVVPGTGEITKQGRVFFSIKPDDAEKVEVSDEEAILRLREVKRSGKMDKYQAYLRNDIVGRGGLEQWYNQYLRGRHRLQRLRLARDEKSGSRRYEPKGDVEKAKNGIDIRLSLRMDVQSKAYEILNEHIAKIKKRFPRWTASGVAIMMNPKNGRINALVSLPSYDPNTFNRDFAKLAGDPALPMLDRALAGIYPPGSVVKPLVGLAALTEDAIMPGQKFNCDRVMVLAGQRFTCLGRHGWLDMESALMHSCNMYFYHTGEALGSRRLYEWYTKTGLGHRTGIDVAGEHNGLIPRRAYTRNGWATGNTYHMSIGQGIAVTPMQIAVNFAMLANAAGDVAHIVRPHLLIPSQYPQTPEEEELAREAALLDMPVSEIMVDRDAVRIIRQGMWETVQGRPGTDEHGTGMLAAFYNPRDPGSFLFEHAGKTGTAEWSRVVGGMVVKQVSHVWYAGYAPFDRPEVVVVVFLPEAGVGGGALCAPIAKDLLRMWFNMPEERFEHEEGSLG